MIGMTYKILPTKEFSRDFEKLDPQLKRRVKDKIEEYVHSAVIKSENGMCQLIPLLMFNLIVFAP